MVSLQTVVPDRSFHGLFTTQWTEVFTVCLQFNGQKCSWFVYNLMDRHFHGFFTNRCPGQTFSWFLYDPVDISFHGLFTTQWTEVFMVC